MISVFSTTKNIMFKSYKSAKRKALKKIAHDSYSMNKNLIRMDQKLYFTLYDWI